jgi:C4-dicarboxylate transporter DctM subunit
MSLFVATSISGLPLLKIARQTLPLLIILFVIMLVIVFIPELSLAIVPTR